MSYVDMKRCPACEEVKPLEEFPLVSTGMADRRSYCKPCARRKRREAYQRAGGRDEPYKQVLKREYGITLADYNGLLDRQAHRCRICRRPETVKYKNGTIRRLAVDHDHVTGRVRGLLCHRCNILVWAFEENHTTLTAIEAYLDDFRASFARQ